MLEAGEGQEKSFGSVTNHDIATKLKEAGHDIDRKKIDLPKPIKDTGDHEVTVKLALRRPGHAHTSRSTTPRPRKPRRRRTADAKGAKRPYKAKKRLRRRRKKLPRRLRASSIPSSLVPNLGTRKITDPLRPTGRTPCREVDCPCRSGDDSFQYFYPPCTRCYGGAGNLGSIGTSGSHRCSHTRRSRLLNPTPQNIDREKAGRRVSRGGLQRTEEGRRGGVVRTEALSARRRGRGTEGRRRRRGQSRGVSPSLEVKIRQSKRQKGQTWTNRNKHAISSHRNLKRDRATQLIVGR